jgi:hypothetical protein
MKYAFCFLAAALTIASVPAFAAGACYTAEQLQAEQALRLHSELMVITVTCKQGSNGENLPAAYGDFTKKNITMLHEAEQTMTAYYKAKGGGNPQDQLDRLRTRLANEFGQKAADVGSASFCAEYGSKVVKMDTLSHADVDNEVERMKIADHSYVKQCSAKTTAAAK